MERAAHLQRQAALCTGLQRQAPGLLHGVFLAADHDLPGAVQIADLRRAQSRCLFAALGQRLAPQPQNGDHGALHALGRLGHGLAAALGQQHRLRRVKHARRLQRRILSQRQSGQIIRPNARLLQNRRDTGGKGHHTGLGVLGLVQNAVGVLKAHLVQIKPQLLAGRIKGLAKCGKRFVYIAPHAGVLASLPGVYNGKLHCCILHSVITSSISSFTERILSSRPTFEPQKNSPFSTSPCTARISAWVMQ